ncbi:MAG: ABC transporter ATP-binding protein [Termitinemataceae bacterium]|nr:MAG: ABC transporter ATP-binding protein [Termitinemataceae bacterium]
MIKSCKAETLIDIKNVQREYFDVEGNQVVALKDIKLEIKKGEFITFIGASGCGKTTLLRLIAGLDMPDKGSLHINGVPITKAGRDRGYIFQAPTLFPWNTVEENVAIALKACGQYEQKKDRIEKYINMIGLSGFEKTYPHQLSGGMAQRVAIIRALINEPEVLLLDEPLGALDAFKRIEMQDQLLAIKEKTESTFAMVTHDVDEAIYLSDRVVVMSPRPGRIVHIVDIDLGAERNRSGSKFTELRKLLLKSLHNLIKNPFPDYVI